MSIPTKARVAKCRANQKRVEVLFRPEEYLAIADAAKGTPIGSFIKSVLREKLKNERSGA